MAGDWILIVDDNPTNLKLARILLMGDGYQVRTANDAEEEFVRRFRDKEVPGEVEERTVASQTWKLPRLLVETTLAPSIAEARRLIEQGGVRVDGVRRSNANDEIELSRERPLHIQIGKRRFLRVRGE